MITEKKFLICTCDSCGRLLFEDGNCVFEDKDALKMAMMDEKWEINAHWIDHTFSNMNITHWRPIELK